MTMERVLVTGANGFVGQHVVQTLREEYDCEIVGLTKNPTISEELAGKLDQHIVCDLTRPEEVAKLDMRRITGVINLAGIAVNNPKEDQSAHVIATNVATHTTLYEHILHQDARPRIIAVSSGAIYSPDQPMPLHESSKKAEGRGVTAYIASKLAMEKTLGAFTAQRLDVITVRPFNHTGPLQLPGFLVPDWAHRLTQLQPGEAPDTSWLGSWRDFLDGRDVSRAYAKLLFADQKDLSSGVYNICSGKPVQTFSVVRMLAAEMGVHLPSEGVAGSESVIYGSNKRLTEDTGWTQTIPLEKTIRDFAAWHATASAQA